MAWTWLNWYSMLLFSLKQPNMGWKWTFIRSKFSLYPSKFPLSGNILVIVMKVVFLIQNSDRKSKKSNMLFLQNSLWFSTTLIILSLNFTSYEGWKFGTLNAVNVICILIEENLIKVFWSYVSFKDRFNLPWTQVSVLKWSWLRRL